jgi:chromosome segregation ATPase
MQMQMQCGQNRPMIYSVIAHPRKSCGIWLLQRRPLSPQKPEAKKLLEQAVMVILEQSKELTETKVVAKQVIESLVAQNRLFLNTHADLQNTIKGLKWKLQQMSQSMKQTEALLKECSGTIGKLNQSLAGKDRAHSHTGVLLALP